MATQITPPAQPQPGRKLGLKARAGEALAVKAAAKLKLPHPHLTTYYIVPAGRKGSGGEQQRLRIQPSREETNTSPIALHHEDLSFTSAIAPADDDIPSLKDNSPWGRSQRAALTQWEWTTSRPSIGQVWLLVYAIVTMQSDLEIFRVRLSGPGQETLAKEIIRSMIGWAHPAPLDSTKPYTNEDLVLSRSAFWQGAASPFNGRPPWTPYNSPSIDIQPVEYTISTGFPNTRVHQRHPRRPLKPEPGAVVYSRYIPSLDEHFSLIVVDHTNESHVALFSAWQNDPRVARGWNRTGTLGEHREYLRRQHEDSHSLPVFGRFDDTSFSYFELYWCKEDHLGVHYNAGDYDRGRQSLVGNARYRGRHRVLGWWPSIIHFCLLDDPRTATVIGEPDATNNTVLSYDYLHGLNLESFVDFPGKRAALVSVTRERFFQICPFNQTEGNIAGTNIPLPSKL